MTTNKQTVEHDRVLAEVTAEQLLAITGGSIDVDVPQCGNVFPHGPYPNLMVVSILPVQQPVTR
jgi:hypothetical protein